MSLVAYSSSSSSSSSSSEDDENNRNVIHTISSDTLPNKLKDLNAPDQHTEVNESHKHEGRIRSFPHERGNWATFVYIPYKLTDSISLLQQKIKELFEEEFSLTFHSLDTIHLSLSRTVTLKHHWIEPFLQSIRQCSRHFNRFILDLQRLSVYCNDDQTRTFISLRAIDSTEKILNEMVHSINSIMSEYNLDRFYEEASFHVSILWCLGNKKQIVEEMLGQLQTILDELMIEEMSDFQTKVENIECKYGHRINCFAFE